MLFIVLVLVLGALGLLVTALVTAQSLWAWISIGVSALAGLLLVVDVVRRRARRTATEAEGSAGTAERTEVTPSGSGSDGDPTEEDQALGTEPADEVLVVDEHPRYHRAGCSWLAGRETIAISAREARELGFTPCSRCAPDGRLAAGHRAST